MIASVNGTVVQRKGSGAERQPRPKTDASIRRIPVPEFAAVVLRRRIADMPPSARTRTIFASRTGGPLSPYNVRRTFREFLQLADLAAAESVCAGTGAPQPRSSREASGPTRPPRSSDTPRP